MARSKIAVAGGTGRVGHHVVDLLESRGHEVVAMSRSSGVDVITGDGRTDVRGVAQLTRPTSSPRSTNHSGTRR